MELPAELRNKIYEHCLIDYKCIYLRSRQRKHRNYVVRSPMEKSFHWSGRIVNPCSGARRRQIANAKAQGSATAIAALVVSILLISKQIFNEASPMLYAQSIHVTDTHTLLLFLAQLTPRCASMLRNINIHSWGPSRGVKGVNFSAMFLLAVSGATNLERLTFDFALSSSFVYYGCRGGSAPPGPERLARMVYRNCYPWLDAVAAAKGDRNAGVDVLKMNNYNFHAYVEYRRSTGGGKEVYAEVLARAKEIY